MPIEARYSENKLAIDGGYPVVNIGEFPLDRVSVSQDLENSLLNTFNSGGWSMFTSPEIIKFEDEFSNHIGSNYTVLMNSCTSSIYAALMAHKVTKGKIIGVPAYTYIGTCIPAISLGAKLVFIDITSDTQTLSPESLETEFKKYKMDLIIQAHLFGKVSYASEIFSLCKLNGASYISDCAQVIGLRKSTQPLMDFGISCFSFGESKLLRIGEGGAACSNNEELIERIKLTRHEGELWLNHNISRINGWSPSPFDVINNLASVQIGLNFRPNSLIASIGRVKLKELNSLLEKNKKNADYLLKHLSVIEEIKLPSSSERTWWTFPIIINSSYIDRNFILAALLAEGIPAGVHFPRLMNKQPILQRNALNKEKAFFNAKFFSDNHIVLPIYPALDEFHMDLIVKAINKIFKTKTSIKNRGGHSHLKKMKIKELCSGLFMFLTNNS